MKNQFAPAAKPSQPPAPSATVVKGFFGLMKTSAPGFLELMVDQYPGLLEAKGSPSGGTPLVYAAELGRLDLVKMLHAKGASLLASDNGDQGALFYAGYKGHPDVAEYLIGQGLDPHLKNRGRLSPIDIANASDLQVFGEQMERQRAAYLMKQEELARLKAAKEQREMSENLRQITENVRRGVAGAISAPEKASFKRKA